MKQMLTTKMLKLGSKTLPIILTALPFAMMSQAFAGQADCVPNTLKDVLDTQVFAQVGEYGDSNIYFCARADVPRQENIDILDIDIIERGSQAINMGEAQAAANIGTSRIDIAGFNVNDDLPTTYVFRRLNRDAFKEIFHFTAYAPRTGFIKDKTGLEPYNYCRGAEGIPTINHYQNILEYLKVNGQKFSVNGTPAIPDFKSIDAENNQFASATVTVDGADMTVKFIARRKGGFFYGHSDLDAVYCLTTVGVQASVDLDTARAKNYNLQIRYAGN